MRFELVEQRLGHRVTNHDDGEHALFPDELPRRGRVEPAVGEEHDLAAAVEMVEREPVRAGMHQRRRGERTKAGLRQSIGQLGRAADDVAELRAVPPMAGDEDVLVAPDHALRHAGRATGVDQVQVVVGPPRGVRPLRLLRREGGVVVDRSVDRSLAAVVVDVHERAQGSATPEGAGHTRRERPVVDERAEAGVVVQVTELLLDVAVVHVDRYGADLERREHALDVLGAVEQLEANVVPGSDAGRGEVVGQPVRAFVQLAVGESPVAGDEDLALGIGVGDGLVEVGQVQAHWASSGNLTGCQIIVRRCNGPPA